VRERGEKEEEEKKLNKDWKRERDPERESGRENKEVALKRVLNREQRDGV
jgi:hypothetical protein